MDAVPSERESEKTSAPHAVAVDAAPSPTRLYRILHLVSRPLVQKLYRLRVEGLEHIPGRGDFVLAANHTSNLDPWPLGIALWPRSLHFMAKHEAWRPPLKWLIAGYERDHVRVELTSPAPDDGTETREDLAKSTCRKIIQEPIASSVTRFAERWVRKGRRRRRPFASAQWC